MRSDMPPVILTIASLLVAAGCTDESPDAHFARVQTLAAERTGHRVEWDGHTADDRAVAARVDDLLARALTPDAAVQVALLNNQTLQATFEELGIAQADFVQAGLLQNPVVDLGIRFPDRRPAKTYIDVAVVENFLSLFLIPARKKIAAAQLEQATARVSNEVLTLASQTKSAFYAYQAAEQTVALRQRIADAAAASLEAAERLRAAGNTSDLDYFAERARAARATVELGAAQADADDAREQLNALMGVGGSRARWKIEGRLPDLPADEVPAAGLEELAIRQRQDLDAARQEVLAQARMYHLTVDTRFWSQADAGIEGERETEGQWRIGPTVSVPLPLFDQGQAAVPRAAGVLRQAQHRYAALAADVRSQVRAARKRLLHARAAAQLYHDEVLPTQQKYLDEAQLHYNGMFLSVFDLLQAKRAEIDAAAQYIQALKTYWTTRAELERAVGGRLPPGQPATVPTSIPAETQSDIPDAPQHHHHHGD